MGMAPDFDTIKKMQDEQLAKQIALLENERRRVQPGELELLPKLKDEQDKRELVRINDAISREKIKNEIISSGIELQKTILDNCLIEREFEKISSEIDSIQLRKEYEKLLSERHKPISFFEWVRKKLKIFFPG